MKSVVRGAALVASIFAQATLSLAAPPSKDEALSEQRYCWYDSGWNSAGWYRCGFAKKPGQGWGGPKGWPGAAETQPSSGAWFELPPPTPPVSAPSSAFDRNVQPLRGGPAPGSPAQPLRR